jgi:hypothetical protein
VDRGVFPLLFPEVHNHLLSFVDVEYLYTAQKNKGNTS